MEIILKIWSLEFNFIIFIFVINIYELKVWDENHIEKYETNDLF